MIWPAGQRAPDPLNPLPGHRLERTVEQAAFCAVQRAIGFEVSDALWAAASAQWAASVVLVGPDDAPLAVACGTRGPAGVELGWVAVVPSHRGRGLAYQVCSALTRRLVLAGEGPLFGSTQDHRLAALAVYFKVGFVPVPRPNKRARWRAVCAQLGVAFEPERWAICAEGLIARKTTTGPPMPLERSKASPILS